MILRPACSRRDCAPAGVAEGAERSNGHLGGVTGWAGSRIAAPIGPRHPGRPVATFTSDAGGDWTLRRIRHLYEATS